MNNLPNTEEERLVSTLQDFILNEGWKATAKAIRKVVKPYVGQEVNGQDWFAELDNVLLEKPKD